MQGNPGNTDIPRWRLTTNKIMMVVDFFQHGEFHRYQKADNENPSEIIILSPFDVEGYILWMPSAATLDVRDLLFHEYRDGGWRSSES